MERILAAIITTFVLVGAGWLFYRDGVLPCGLAGHIAVVVGRWQIAAELRPIRRRRAYYWLVVVRAV